MRGECERGVTSSPAHEKIAGVFYRAGLVERYGSGIERIIRAFRDARTRDRQHAPRLHDHHAHEFLHRWQSMFLNDGARRGGTCTMSSSGRREITVMMRDEYVMMRDDA